MRRLLTAQDLPRIAKPTYAAAQARRFPRAHDHTSHWFSVQLVTSELHKPRVIRVAPNGDLFVADSMFNKVYVLRIAPQRPNPSVMSFMRVV